MFTGLIEATAVVLESQGGSLTIARPPSFGDISIGSSIAVAGVCLSIVELSEDSMKFDLTEETLARTTIGRWKKGDRVNLERAMKAGDRLDGHIVQGHVDCVGSVMVSPTNHDAVLKISYPNTLKHLIVEKGSIAIDGVSLTVTEVDEQFFSVAIIPHTLKETTLGRLKEGDSVNLEADIMAKYARPLTAK
jgi:riboflavin synthase